MKAVLIVLALAGTAHADRWSRMADEFSGAAWLHYELTGLDRVQDEGMRAASVKQLVLAGARLHGIVGHGHTLAYHIGLDLAAGGTVGQGGFAYDVALLPIGIAVRPNERAFFALGTGVGAMGGVPSLDGAVTLPIDLTAELGNGRVRLLGRARVSYVAGAPSRDGGAPSLPTGDELEAMLGVRIGHGYHEYGFSSGNGYFVAASYRELEGARFAGVTLGYSIDLASPTHL
ncbi:MAG TPA: hypothetical protein VMJ10_00825 [Kofleriaceae bacterium]|nr:hypothetical protein [Kofleriaceae bacterium]